MSESSSSVRLPVVFLHAFPVDATLWDRERSRLADRLTLAPNLPGFGGRAAATRTLDGFAAAAMADMDAAAIDRAVIIGLSMGGYVALRLYAKWPDRVAAMVLADTRAGADSAEGAAKRTEQAARARAEGIGWLADAFLPNVLGETTRAERPEVVESVRRMIDRADPEGIARALEAMRERPDSTSDLKQIEVPVLAIVGEEDSVTPVDEARRIVEGVQDGTLRVIPRAGHLSNLENPEAFAEALENFLRAVEGA